jgi:hypothetical protein
MLNQPITENEELACQEFSAAKELREWEQFGLVKAVCLR